MRHRKHAHQLGVKKEHRSALMGHLATALFRHGRIRTTLAKAKALRPFAEKIITLAVQAHGARPERALYLRRLAIARVRDKDAVRTLFNERVTEFLERPGGYTRIYKLGARIGDAAEMGLIELVAAADEGYPKTRRKGRKEKAAAKAAAPAAAEVAPEGDAPVAVEDAPSTEEASTEASAEAPQASETPSDKPADEKP